MYRPMDDHSISMEMQLRGSYKQQKSTIEKSKIIRFNKSDRDTQWTKVTISGYDKNDTIQKEQIIEEGVREIINDLKENLWHLQMPKLIISVTGGAQAFSMPLKLKNALKEGLRKAASIQDAWLISGGSNVGVMKLVGDAVADELLKRQMVVLGITTWGVVKHRQEMEHNSPYDYYIDMEKATKNEIFINPNHTHFIFVHDTEDDAIFGHEIDFRTMFERILSNIYEIPTILIVVNGGPNTLKTVVNAVNENIPVLILEKSKGCADLIADVIRESKKTTQGTVEDEALKQLLDQSKLMENVRQNVEQQERVAIDRIKKILDTYNNKETKCFINLFALDKDDGSNNLDLEILRTLLKVHPNSYFNNLKLALEWNRFDLVLNDILTGEEKFNQPLIRLFELALCQNKPEFVALLLEIDENLLIKLNNTTAYSLLIELYKHQFDDIHVKGKPGVFYKLIREVLHKEKLCFMDIKLLLKKLSYNFFDETVIPTVIPDDSEQKIDIIGNLFIWALLHNYIDIAKIFWIHGEYQIANALLASKIVLTIGKYIPEIKIENEDHSIEFENLAIGVLNVCDKETHDEINPVILLQDISYYNSACLLSIAYNCKCEKFMSEVNVQDTLTNVWLNGIEKNEESSFLWNFWYSIKFILSFVTLGLLADFLLFKNKKDNVQLRPDEAKILEHAQLRFPNYTLWKLTKFFKKVPVRLNTNTTNNKIINLYQLNDYGSNNWFLKYLRNFRRYWTSPISKFTHFFTFYILFIVLFSYFVLLDFDKFSVNDQNFVIFGPSVLLSIWIFAFLVEEFNQFFCYDVIIKAHIPFLRRIINKYKIFKNSIKVGKPLYFYSIETNIDNNKNAEEENNNYACDNFINFLKYFTNAIKFYYDDHWNILATLGIALFWINIILKYTNSDIIVVKIIFMIDLIIWFILLLHYFSIFQTIGPTFEMIKQIIKKDLLFFIIVITTFMVGVGICIEATVASRSISNFDLFKSIINNAYWSIYGQIDVLACINNDTQCGIDDFRQSKVELLNFDFILLLIYLIILLILTNVLIAKFNFTVADVNLKANRIWRFQRFRLVFSYATHPILPPPLNLLIYPITFVFNLQRYNQGSKKHNTINPTLSDRHSPEVPEIVKLQRRCAKIFYKIFSIKNTKEDIPKSIFENSHGMEERRFRQIVTERIDRLDEKLLSNLNIMQGLNEKMSEILDKLQQLK